MSASSRPTSCLSPREQPPSSRSQKNLKLKLTKILLQSKSLRRTALPHLLPSSRTSNSSLSARKTTCTHPPQTQNLMQTSSPKPKQQHNNPSSQMKKSQKIALWRNSEELKQKHSLRNELND